MQGFSVLKRVVNILPWVLEELRFEPPEHLQKFEFRVVKYEISERQSDMLVSIL
jgi:hypothetical protein